MSKLIAEAGDDELQSKRNGYPLSRGGARSNLRPRVSVFRCATSAFAMSSDSDVANSLKPIDRDEMRNHAGHLSMLANPARVGELLLRFDTVKRYQRGHVPSETGDLRAPQEWPRGA